MVGYTGTLRHHLTTHGHPEEQEYLVGHFYLRVRAVRIKQPPPWIAMDSLLRLAFFAIHLFQRQMFSMDCHLVHFIAAFIEIHLFNVRRPKGSSNSASAVFKDVLNVGRSPFYRYLLKILKPSKRDKAEPPGVIELSDGERVRKNRIFYILVKKFQQFCEFPNQRQILKIDCVADELKPYFMDRADGGTQDMVSFEKLAFLFPNIRQIHFMNFYRFDDEALQRLIQQIRRRDCKLEQIKFLYYDYRGDLKGHRHFFDPNSLGSKLVAKLNALGWKMSFPRNRNGYTVRLRKN